MNCGCDQSKQAGTCCKGAETTKATASSQRSADKAGHGTGRKP